LESRQKLLLVDDDQTFCKVLKGALDRRNFEVTVAHSVEEALLKIQEDKPEFAVVDMKMSGASGLVLVEALKKLDETMKIVVLTGYASITTAVDAIKLGATQYLPKPANADEIVAAFGHRSNTNLPLLLQPTSVERLEWEHIQRVLHENNGNVSATARALNMYRRTLQRKLLKRPSPNSYKD
jgi:two-component system response regulator RegA